MHRLLEEIGNTTIRYWTNPQTTRKTILVLWLISATLLACCRAASFGVIFDLTNLILALLALVLQGAAALLYLLRAEAQDAGDEAPRLLRLLIIIWIISLGFFFPNLFPGLTMTHRLHPGKIAGLYSLVAVALLALRTVQQDHRDAPREPVDYGNILFWSLVVFVINSLLFFLFVLDSNTTYLIKDNLETLKHIWRTASPPG